MSCCITLHVQCAVCTKLEGTFSSADILSQHLVTSSSRHPDDGSYQVVRHVRGRKSRRLCVKPQTAGFPAFGFRPSILRFPYTHSASSWDFLVQRQTRISWYCCGWNLYKGVQGWFRRGSRSMLLPILRFGNLGATLLDVWKWWWHFRWPVAPSC